MMFGTFDDRKWNYYHPKEDNKKEKIMLQIKHYPENINAPYFVELCHLNDIKFYPGATYHCPDQHTNRLGYYCDKDHLKHFVDEIKKVFPEEFEETLRPSLNYVDVYQDFEALAQIDKPCSVHADGNRIAIHAEITGNNKLNQYKTNWGYRFDMKDVMEYVYRPYEPIKIYLKHTWMV